MGCVSRLLHSLVRLANSSYFLQFTTKTESPTSQPYLPTISILIYYPLSSIRYPIVSPTIGQSSSLSIAQHGSAFRLASGTSSGNIYRSISHLPILLPTRGRPWPSIFLYSRTNISSGWIPGITGDMTVAGAIAWHDTRSLDLVTQRGTIEQLC